MKKAVVIIITVAFAIALLASCNKNVCPAYVMDTKTEQTKSNG